MSRNPKLLYIGFGLVVLLWALNLIALNFYLYWTVGWYDIMMHFLGGMTIGVLVIWFLKLEEKSLKSFLIVFTYVMIIGSTYEIFEYINDLTFSTQKYPIDTVVDLTMDALGVVSAYWWATSPFRSHDHLAVPPPSDRILS